jgi:signal peptidase I
MYAPRTTGHHRWRRLTAAVVGLAALAVGWYAFAPPALGGDASYVVTDGISMRPKIHAGDLAIVRPDGVYRVGDIVAYRSRSLHVVVLHRIIAVKGGGYVFRGDNNSWPDPGPVARSQLVGKLWVLAPGVGGDLRSLDSPAAMAGLAGLAVVLLAGGAGVRHVRRRRRRRPQPKWMPRIAPPPRTAHQPGAHAVTAAVAGSHGSVLAVAAIAAAAFAGVAAVAWTTPTHRIVPATVGYRQSGRFAYSAPTATGAVYMSGRAGTGQPIFTHLAGPVQMRFAYALTAQPAGPVRGTASMSAVLAAPNGWSRTIPLAAPTAFSGRRATVTGTIHLRRLETLVQRVAAATQAGGQSFELTLVPAIRLHGLLAGRRLDTSYAPQLPFTLSADELMPVLPAKAAGTGTTPASHAAIFRPTRTASFTTRESAPVRIGPSRLRTPVTIARILGAAGLVLALAVAAVAGRLLWRARTADEPTRIRTRYGESIVTVVHSRLGRHADLVQVKSIEELARIAERYDSMIIHEQTAIGHAYLVADGTTLYAYLLSTEGSERALREHLTSAHTSGRGRPVNWLQGYETAS